MMRLIVVLLTVPILASAQTLFNQSVAITLDVSPQYPEPRDLVTLTAKSAAIDLNRAYITWSSNGAVIAAGVGIKEVQVEAPQRGSKEITIAAQGEEGSAEASAVIQPAHIEILWRSDSYRPPFYEGRALAGTNATIHAYAHVQFLNNGAPIPESRIVYTWRHRGAVLAQSGLGKSSVTVPGPVLHGADTLSVEAETLDHEWKTGTSITILAIDPPILLYEEHPLFGTLYHRAIVGDVYINDEVQKVTAVPLFAHITSPHDASLQYNWVVNDEPIVADSANPETLTLTSSGYVGPAVIGLSIMNSADYLMRSTGLWRLLFGENQSTVFDSRENNPFMGN